MQTEALDSRNGPAGTAGGRSARGLLAERGRYLALATMFGLMLSTGPAIAADTDLAKQLEELSRQVQALLERIANLETEHAEAVRELEQLHERRLRELEQQLVALEQEDRKERSDDRDELETLREEAERAAGEEEKEVEPDSQPPVGRQRSLQALNPEISYLGDVSYDWTDGGIQDRFLMRATEISFQAALDPYTRFKGFLAAHQELPELSDPDAEPEPEEAEPGEIEVTLEESYMEWVALPLNSRLRVGKFRQQFGTLNRWHPHALPSTDVPFALRNLFTPEGLVGLGIRYDLPIPHFWATTNGLTLEVVNADNPSAFAGSSFRDPAVLLRHTGFFDLGDDGYFELNLNGMIGPNDADGRDTTLGSVDFNFIWEPVQTAKYRSIELRGEYIRSRFDTESGTTESQSFYAYGSWKVSRRWVIGVRYDNAELPWDRFELFDGQEFREGLRERAWTPFVTFWQSEYVRLRAQYQHAERDFAFSFGEDDDDRVWIQVTFAGGPHKHEAY